MFSLYGYGPSIFEGTILTLQVSIVSLLIAMLLGMLGALAKLSGTRSLALIAQLYTTIIRGIPDLVLMLLIFFGGQVLVNQIGPAFGYDEYIDINPFLAGILTIGFIFGAYMTETFRGAILAVSRGQIEAGTAYGMSSFMAFRRITLPQMVRHALPGFGNNWLVLVKTTALVSIIGLDDMVRKAGLAAGATRKPFTFYLVVAVNYLLITSISVYLLKHIERRYSVGVRET
ncbi:MAG: ABC transporter permease [Desulfofustis sp.]|jgi:arginine/ornithine transport system permease protein|nr:ABC transporter permease [Desulfofustis sp.]